MFQPPQRLLRDLHMSAFMSLEMPTTRILVAIPVIWLSFVRSVTPSGDIIGGGNDIDSGWKRYALDIVVSNVTV
jgi:hypothetical protein